MESKKIIYAFIVGFLAVIVLLGIIFGTKKQTKKTEKITLPPISVKILGAIPKERIQPIFDDFKSISNINIDYLYLPASDIYFKFLEMLGTGEVPDGLIIPDDIFLSFQDKVQEIARKDSTDIYEFVKNTYSIQASLIAFPIFLDPIVLIGNKDMLYSLGYSELPKTLNELNKLIIELKSKGINLKFINFGTIDNNQFAPEIVSLLAMQFGADSNNIFSSFSQAWTMALNYYFSFSDPNNQLYSFDEKDQSPEILFAQEKILMAVLPISKVKEISFLNPSINLLISHFPANDLTKRKALVKSYLLIIPKLSKNPEAIKKLASYFYSFPEKVYNFFGLFPSRISGGNFGDLDEFWKKEVLVTRSLLWPKKEIIFSALRQMKIEMNYNKDIGESFIKNFK